jgi:predicted ATP-grasp superfamily ATP-dependent carboligase
MATSQRPSAPVFVLGTGGCNALGVLRAFGRRGIPVTAFGHRPTAACVRSRYGRTIDAPPFEDVDALTDCVLSHARRRRERPIGIVTSDEALRYWLAAHDRLAEGLRMTLGPPEAVRQFVDKAAFARLVDRLGVDGPRTRIVETPQEARSGAADIGYPCLLKPAMSHEFGIRFRLKCFRIDDEIDLDRRWRQASELAQTMLIQELIPGDRFYMWYGYRSRTGKLAAWCGYRKRRRWPPDYGNATLLRPEPYPELVERGDTLLDRVGYCGPAEVEYKYDDRDGRWKIIEVNARTVMQNRLPAALGRDMEYMAYRDALGDPPPGVEPVADGNVLWTETHKDLAAAFCEDGMTIGRWLRSRRGRTVYAFFAWDDPLPAVTRLPEATTAVAGTICRRWFPKVYARIKGRGSVQDDPNDRAGGDDACPIR